jgi:AraC-like DNA-binding protein
MIPTVRAGPAAAGHRSATVGGHAIAGTAGNEVVRVTGTAALAPAPRVFSTAGLPQRRRIELWEDHNAAALIGLSCRTTGAGALEATELTVPAGRVQLARVAGSPHVVERTARDIRHAPADAIAVYVTLRGEAWFEHEGVRRALRPGHVLLCEADRPFARGFARGLEELAIKVPRPAFAERTGLASLPAPVVADFAAGTDPYARALARLAGRAARRRLAVPADEHAVLELVAVLAAGRGAGRPAAYRAAARSVIEDQLTDPGLSAAQVAAAVGISERHLSRVFAADGTSVPRHILARRLELARALLSAPGAPGAPARPVADVAARCGFTSATYFSQAFRRHFGQRAGEVRRQARAAAT